MFQDKYGNKTDITFYDVKVNIAIDNKIFEFRPHEKEITILQQLCQ